MKRAKVWMILISIILGIMFVWFFLFGIRLIGYFSAISERGLRATACGTQGCGNVELLLNVAWALTFFIIIPLIIPSVLTIYFSVKINKK